MRSALEYKPSQRVSPYRPKQIAAMPTLSAVLASESSLPSDGGVGPAKRFGNSPSMEAGLDEKLFTATADAKIWTSRMAMHLRRETRDRLFHQLNALHELEDWSSEDRPVALESYKSFVRAILYHNINSKPALALMPNGNVLAMWQDGADRLTIEFQPGNRTRWLVQGHTDNGPERTTSTTSLERLREVLQPYGASRWFDGS